MLFTCVPGIWQQVPESNQNCSDNYKTKQPLTTTISPDPISDPIGAVLDYFGLLSLDISIADCAGGVSAATLPARRRLHTLNWLQSVLRLLLIRAADFIVNTLS